MAHCILKGNHVNHSQCLIPSNVCADSGVIVIKDALLHESNLNTSKCGSNIRVEFQFDESESGFTLFSFCLYLFFYHSRCSQQRTVS